MMKKRCTLLLCMALMLISIPALAENILRLPKGLKTLEDEAFFALQSADSVILPDGMETIGSKAFANSTVSSVYLPPSLTHIAADAFDDCDFLTASVRMDSYAQRWCEENGLSYELAKTDASAFSFSVKNREATITAYTGTDTVVVIPETLGSYPVRAIGEEAFAFNTSITDVIFPTNLRTIAGNAFMACDNLSGIFLQDGLETIDYDAFAYCAATDIWIPASVSFLDYGAFRDSPSLERFEVDENNAVYSSQDGVLFNDCGTRLHAYPSGRTDAHYAVPEGVTTIGAWSIYNNYIESIVLPESVHTLEDYAIAFCENLQSIDIPANVIDIGDNAFYGCDNLTLLIPYGSPAEEWCWYHDVPYELKKTDESAFSFTVSAGAATITGYTGEDTAIVVPETLGGYPVRTIGEEAFAFNYDITSIILLENLRRIANNAFFDCASLNDVTMLDGLETIEYDAFAYCAVYDVFIPRTVSFIDYDAFRDCENLYRFEVDDRNPVYSSQDEVLFDDGGARLYIYPSGKTDTSYTVPDGVTAIGGAAFFNDNLKSVVLPYGVDTIEDYAFSFCDNLTSIVIPESVFSIGENAFPTEGNLVATVVSGSYAHGWCTINDIPFNPVFSNPEDFSFSVSYGEATVTAYTGSNTRVMIPETLGGYPVRSIGTEAFISNTDIREIILPSTLRRVEDYAFFDCINLSRVIIPNGVETIGLGAFMYCAFTEVNIPASVTYLDCDAFYGCNSLEQVHVSPYNMTYVSFDGVVFSDDYTRLHFYPNGKRWTSYTVYGDIETIGTWAFSNSSIKHVTLHEGVRTLEDFAFNYCPYLTEVIVPASVTTIGQDVFAECEDLVVSVVYGSYAHQWCRENGVAYKTRAM